MNELVTEQVAECVLCGNAESETLVSGVRDRQHRLPGEFTLRRCLDCGLVRLSPRPDSGSLGRYYPASDYPAYLPATAVDTARRLVNVRETVRTAALSRLGYPARPGVRVLGEAIPPGLVRRAAYGIRGFPPHQAHGRVLDVGCGSGFALSRLARHGWETVGLDVSEAAAAASRAQGLRVIVAEIEDAGLEPQSFDFVRMSHVIEHARDPMAMLGAVSRLLVPGGAVYIETPNIKSDAFRRSGRFWFPLEAPRHLWLFDTTTLRRAIAAVGLREVSLLGVPLPTTQWDETYSREERRGEALARRPVADRVTRIRAVRDGVASRRTARAAPDRAEVIAVLATR